MTTTNNFLTTDATGKQIFTNAFTRCAPADLIVKLLTFSLIEGVGKMEQIVKNTYTLQDANRILGGVNLALMAIGKK